MLAVRQFLQQGSSSLTGAIADRIGPKPLMCFGMLIRAIGFLVLAAAGSYVTVMAAAVLMALGGGFFESPQAAATAALTTLEDRRRFYALNGTVAGLGTSLGTQAGALLINLNFAAVAVMGAATFAVIFVVIMVFMPSVSVSIGSQSAWEGLRLAVSDRLFVGFNLLLMGFWFMYTQFSISLPLAAKDISGHTSAVAWVYAVNSIVTVVLGYVLPRALERRLGNFPMLVAGIALTAVGMIAIGWADSLVVLLLCVFVLSIGMVLARPVQQTISAGLARPDALGAFLGVGALSLAIGGGIGNYTGGVIYDVGSNNDLRWLPWVVFGAIGLSAAIGMTLFRNALESRQAELAEALPYGDEAAERAA